MPVMSELTITSSDPLRLGVLGGMGPMATVDFLRKIVALTPAATDQDHIPIIVHNVPQIPNRVAAILNDGLSPLASMVKGALFLKHANVAHVAIPCNTAHAWHDEIVAATGVRTIHIVDAVIEAMAAAEIRRGQVGILGTAGTRAAGIYDRRLAEAGYAPVWPSPATQDALVDRAILAVKRNAIAEARGLLLQAESELMGIGIGAMILACTEIPVALDGQASSVLRVDSTEALAAACVRRCLAGRSR